MFSFEIQKTRAGLNLITAPLKDSQTITVLVMVKTGSCYESKALNGISHFLEHMFFKGSEMFPSSLKLASSLDALGADYNAFTTKEYTGFWVKSDSRQTDKLLLILSDMLQRPLLAPAEMEREKLVILEEMNMYQDMPMRYVGDLFENLIYGDNSQGRLIIGEPETVNNLDQTKLKSYLDKQYIKANTYIFAVGRLEEERLVQKIDHYFSAVKIGQGLDKPPTKIRQIKPRFKLLNKKTDQIHLVLGLEALAAGDPDIYALAVLTLILGGNMSSRLFTKIREKMGLAYYVSASSESYSDSGYLAIKAGLNKEKLLAAIEAILKELLLLKDKGVTVKELGRAKEYLKGKLLLSLETSDEIAFFLGEQLLVKNQITAPSEILDKIEAVNLPKLKLIAEKTLAAKKLNLALIGETKEDTVLKSLLNSYQKKF